MSLPSLSSTFINPTTQPPPPSPQDDPSTNQNTENTEDGDIDDSDDDGDDTIKTEEDVEEAPIEVFPKDRKASKSIFTNRSFKILTQIVEPFNEQLGVEGEMEKYTQRVKEAVKPPAIHRIYIDNMNIIFDSSMVGSVMESTDENLTVPTKTRNAMGAVCKVFLAELVDEALRVKREMNETGPLRPDEVAAAYRRLNQRGLVPKPRKPVLFTGFP